MSTRIQSAQITADAQIIEEFRKLAVFVQSPDPNAPTVFQVKQENRVLAEVSDAHYPIWRWSANEGEKIAPVTITRISGSGTIIAAWD